MISGLSRDGGHRQLGQGMEQFRLDCLQLGERVSSSRRHFCLLTSGDPLARDFGFQRCKKVAVFEGQGFPVARAEGSQELEWL